MRFLHRVLLTGLAVAAILPASASRTRRGPTSSKHKTVKARKAAATAHPRAIDDSRAAEIQSALVKAGYLHEVSGHWDNESQAAMQKLQSDNGWQTKLIPDSRALIKLGLGPNARNDTSSANALTSSFAALETQSGN